MGNQSPYIELLPELSEVGIKQKLMIENYKNTRSIDK